MAHPYGCHVAHPLADPGQLALLWGTWYQVQVRREKGGRSPLVVGCMGCATSESWAPAPRGLVLVGPYGPGLGAVGLGTLELGQGPGPGPFA